MGIAFAEPFSQTLYCIADLRTILVKEAGDGVMAYHIFRNDTLQQISKKIPRTKDELLEIKGIGKAKVTKYGDRVLETIEATIKEHKIDKTSGSNSNDSADSMKRRRDTVKERARKSGDDEDFTESTGRSKKRTLKKQNSSVEATDSGDLVAYNDCIFDDDMDFDDLNCDVQSNSTNSNADVNNGGRVLPSWSSPATKVSAWVL